jgi:hypothetical protein
MLRTTLAALVAGIAGAALGAGFMNARMQPEVAAILQQTEQLRAQVSVSESRAASVEADREKIDRERAATIETIEALESKVAVLESAQASPTSDSQDRAAVVRLAPDATAETPNRQTSSAAGERAEKQDSPETEAGGTERQAAVNRVRETIRSFYDTQLSNTADPERQERLLALAEYADLGIDLRLQLEQVTDPEERAVISRDLRATYANHDMYLRAEQNAQLIQTAQQIGLTDPAQINQFVDAMQPILRDPLFQPNSPVTGGRGVFLPLAPSSPPTAPR